MEGIKQGDNIIYILEHVGEKEQKAADKHRDIPWTRVIIIKMGGSHSIWNIEHFPGIGQKLTV